MEPADYRNILMINRATEVAETFLRVKKIRRWYYESRVR